MPDDSDSVNIRFIITNESATNGLKFVHRLLEELTEEWPWREDVGKGLAAVEYAIENLKPRMVSEEKLDKLPFAISYSKDLGRLYLIVNDRPERTTTKEVYDEGGVQIQIRRDRNGSLTMIEIWGIETKEK